MRTKFRALRAKTVGWHLLSVAIVAVFAAPLLFALSLSLRQIDRTLPTTMEWLPNTIVLGNYARALADGNLIRYGLNSLLVVAVALPVTLVVASWAGLAMARGGHAVQRRMVAFCAGPPHRPAHRCSLDRRPAGPTAHRTRRTRRPDRRSGSRTRRDAGGPRKEAGRWI